MWLRVAYPWGYSRTTSPSTWFDAVLFFYLLFGDGWPHNSLNCSICQWSYLISEHFLIITGADVLQNCCRTWSSQQVNSFLNGRPFYSMQKTCPPLLRRTNERTLVSLTLGTNYNKWYSDQNFTHCLSSCKTRSLTSATFCSWRNLHHTSLVIIHISSSLQGPEWGEEEPEPCVRSCRSN